MSLEICRDDLISPRNALIAVAFLAFTVYLRALFFLYHVKLIVVMHSSNDTLRPPLSTHTYTLGQCPLEFRLNNACVDIQVTLTVYLCSCINILNTRSWV